MTSMRSRIARQFLLCGLALTLASSQCVRAAYQMKEERQAPVVLSAHLRSGVVVYELNGRVVDDSRANSMLIDLETIVKAKGAGVPVFVIIDIRASLSEAGKLETALDKTGLTHYRLFVSDFRSGTMNEIHWDESPVPMPKFK